MPMKRDCLTSAHRGSPAIRHVSPCIKYFSLAILFFLTWGRGFSQNDSTQQTPVADSAEIKYDSAKNKLFNYIKQFGDSGRRKNLLEFTEDTIPPRQDETIELIKNLTLEAQSYL